MTAKQVNMFILHTRALLCGNLLCFGINKSGWTRNVYFYVYFFYFFFVFILLKTWFCCRIWILIVFFRELSINIHLHANVKQHLKSLCCFPINVSQGYNTVTWGYETMCQGKISPPEDSITCRIFCYDSKGWSSFCLLAPACKFYETINM